MTARGASTYWELVATAAERAPDRTVLSDDHGRSLTTQGLRDAACGTAAALAERGVGPGSIVSWQLPTTLETMVVMAALTRLGAVQNPIIPVLREQEVGFITAQSGTEFLLVPETWRGYGHGALARSLAAASGFEVIVIDHDTSPERGLRCPFGDPSRLPSAPEHGEAARWIYYSSGTTAAPKGVRHNDLSIVAGSAGVVDMVGTAPAPNRPSDVNPIAFPISHIGGAAMLAAALLTDMRLVLFDAFDPATTPFAIAAHRPTFLGTATPFYVAYLAAQRSHGAEPLFPALRACLAGGGPITAELGRQVREALGVRGIANAWGLTEFPVATSPAFDSTPDLLDHTVGGPVSGVSVCVSSEGELLLKGPQCFLGYVDAELDADAFDAEGWFRTGDLGTVDAEGNVRVTGRTKDAIIRNAENVSALDVEGVLATCPGVADVAVIGVPDERTGERVCAVVVPSPDAAVTLAALVEHCLAAKLARYKHPERMELVDGLPRNALGKVLKKELRATFG
ncbi:MAG: cyclohexanecarboxylate-CoA ligase [Mycobacterium sp.]|nr:cyclohexanecarboxylate-CoA ligase [Mycobacterium sp.]